MDIMLSASEGYKVSVRGVFYYTYQVSGETAEFKQFLGQSSVSQVHDVGKFSYGQLR